MNQLSEPSKPSELKVHGARAPQRVGASDHEEERKAAGGGDEPDDDANAERDDDADADAALLERSAKD